MIMQTKIPEKFLYEIWKNQNIHKEIFTACGEMISVFEPGTENTDNGGPDFLNARIKIGNITYVGDVEIDNLHSDWKTHGHNINKRYNKVILHAVLSCDPNSKFVYTQEGRKVPTVCFDSFLEEGINASLRKAIVSERENKTNKIPCHEIASTADEKIKIDFLFELGIERFKKKCERMVHRLKELLYLSDLHLKEPVVRYEIPPNYYDKTFTVAELNKREIWEQLFYEEIFEALGYSQNKTIMMKLAQSANIEILRSLTVNENVNLAYESILFNIAGLVPDVINLPGDEASEYTKEIVKIWSNLRGSYDGRIYTEHDWHFFRLRPLNFPTLRIAGGARIADKILNHNLISVLVKKFTEIHNHTVLSNSVKSLLIIKADGYWSKHYVFDKETPEDIHYFIGSSRADEIYINVILPFMYIYFDLFGKKSLAQKVLKIFGQVSINAENSLVTEIAESLSLHNAWKRTVIYQGMIELFRSYCTKQRCLDCRIGTKVFG
jgi:hypothetical protein